MANRDTDNLAHLPDGEVERRFRHLQRLISGRKFSKEKQRHLEIEACYVYREFEHRNNRRKAHAEYLKTVKPKSYRRNHPRRAQ